MRVMIHACPKRMWYVEGYLVPKLVEQGIPKKSIVVWNDEAGKGNLVSCMEAFQWCGEHPVKDGTWHLQDDVIPAVDFAKKAESIKDDVACGFRPGHRGRLERRCMRERNENGGYVSVKTQGWTFQCFRISDRIAGECAKWFFEEAPKDERFREAALPGHEHHVRSAEYRGAYSGVDRRVHADAGTGVYFIGVPGSRRVAGSRGLDKESWDLSIPR